MPEAGLGPLCAAYTVRVREAADGLDLAMLREARGLVPCARDHITEEILERAPTLGIIAQFGVGTDNIDLAAARRRGVVVTHTPGAVTDSTADFAFALLLAVARRTCRASASVRSGSFSETLGIELRGKVLGILGLGRTGAAMARRALGFGMEVVYHNRSRANPTIERESAATFLDFPTLLERSDIISVHCDLNADSHHLMDGPALRRMKPKGILINTARGPIVDEEELVRVLEAGHLCGVGLDVFEHEPVVHPGLLACARVVMAPHLGSATIEARSAMARMVSESILACLGGARSIPHRLV